MQSRIILPANMRPLCGNESSVAVEANSWRHALEQLCEKYPEVQPRLLDAQGELLGYVNVFINNRNVRDETTHAEPLPENAEILVVAALAGG